jgi:hypothetical protein
METILELKREFKSDIGNTMVIELYYDLGGYNYFSEEYEPRGYKLSFTHAFIECGSKQIALTNNKNFRLLVKEAKRKSKKTGEKLIKEIEKHQDELFKAFSEDDKEKCFNIIKNLKI